MRSLVVAACAAALVFGVSSCSEDEPGSMEPTAAPGSSAAPPGTLGPMPQIATEHSRDGAANFVSYYARVLDYASKTGDVDELERLSDSSCAGCTDFIELYRTTYDNGGWIRDSDWTIGETNVRFSSAPGAESIVTMNVIISAGSAKRDSRSTVERKPKSRGTMAFAAQFSDGWRITQVGSGDAR